MSKSVLYASNTSNQTLTVGDVINFGSIVRKYGCNCNLSGGNVIVSGTGYYNIDTIFTLTASAAGTAVITLFKDGVAIPGGVATFTMAEGDLCAVSIPTMIRQNCCCDATIRAVLTGVAVTMNNAAIIVEKE